MGAQVKVEVVKGGMLSYLLQEHGSATTDSNPQVIEFYSNHAYVINYSSNTLQSFNIADPAAPYLVGSVSAMTSPSGLSIHDGVAYVCGGANTFRAYDISVANQPTLLGSTSTLGYEDDVVIQYPYAYVTSQATNTIRIYNVLNTASMSLVGSVSTSAGPNEIQIHEGYAYVSCETANAIDVFYVSNGSAVFCSSFATDTGSRSIAIADGFAYVANSTANTMQIFDVSNPYAVSLSGYAPCNVAPISVSIDGDYCFVVSRNNSQLHVFNVTDKTAPVLVGLIVTASAPQNISIINHVPFVVGSSNTIKSYVFFDNSIQSTSVLLGDVAESECLQSGLLTAGDLDVTELTDQVRGYRVSSLSPLRGGIDQLRKAWPFDAIQHGYQILFKKRGGASVATIAEGELDARAAGADPGVRISNVREMDLIMPQQLTVQYMDATREYDVNVAEESR